MPKNVDGFSEQTRHSRDALNVNKEEAVREQLTFHENVLTKEDEEEDGSGKSRKYACANVTHAGRERV